MAQNIDIAITDWDHAEVGQVSLNPQVFGTEVRADIVKRVIDWQLAKRRAGTHTSRKRSEINRTKKKSVRQKGSGGARHGSRASNIFRGGAKAFAPVMRSYAYPLPKAIRRLGLRSALSDRVEANQLHVLAEQPFPSPKTAALRSYLTKAGWEQHKILFVVDHDVNLTLAARNLGHVTVLPACGLNVYDMIRHAHTVISAGAIDAITQRLLPKVNMPHSAQTQSAPAKTTQAKTTQAQSAQAESAQAKPAQLP